MENENIIAEKTGEFGKILIERKGLKFLNYENVDLSKLDIQIFNAKFDEEGYLKISAELKYDGDTVINFSL